MVNRANAKVIVRAKTKDLPEKKRVFMVSLPMAGGVWYTKLERGEVMKG